MLHSVDVDGEFAGGLNGIGVEVDVGLGSDAANFFHWLGGSEFVIRVHDGEQDSFTIADSNSRATRRDRSDRRDRPVNTETDTPRFSSAWHVFSTASCSIAVVMM